MLLPASLQELIKPHHPVHFVNRVIDKIDVDELIKEYKGGRCSSYHPRMLLKILGYGYLKHVYSSGKLAAAVSENIHFMWLAGMQTPDHKTINRFRGTPIRH